ncbi:hypothetical protein DPEC_G00016490 [Dallia pectoralis]|uniref:Uncharacterized protein n=1 Tax=Dallia pectoralis TaxID=75939 RepID=A0ACC2HMN8_DALPE|nr:hypothetical protein DPEC_G00016490 [Dallia pectoralis]
MPFGCLALRDGRNLNSISDVTDKYEIGQVLKAKEFCELCLAKDRQTNKVFVCKKFFKKDGRKVRKAAKNEILILKMVNHPNILQLIDTFETKKEFFIIQELATGGDVFDWILDQGNYTERDASNVIRQVLEAVAYLHSLNIVHRNLKLENLMYYTENNHKKVVLRDFYLSKFENGSITEPCGTPEYLAPEVVARHRYGRPVDCWAVGVIMYILLSGNPPFYDETEEENTDLHNRIIFCRIVAGEFEFDSPYWDDISVPAKELVCRLMEVDQMLRITAADALFHEWIAGNVASEKNLKDGVCAQFEKNFAKAKWRKAIRVTTFMQRLRASEAAASEAAREAGGQAGLEGGGPQRGRNQGGGAEVGETKETDETPGRVEVTVEASSQPEARNGRIGEEKTDGERSGGGKISPSATKERLSQAPNQSDASSKHQGEEPEKAEVVPKASSKTTDTLGSTKTTAGTKTLPTVTSELTKPQGPVPDISASPVPRIEEKRQSPYATAETPTTQRRKMAAHLHNTESASTPATAAPVPAATAPPADRKAAAQVSVEDSSWCQTQLPEEMAERHVGGGTGLGVGSMGVETGMEKGEVIERGVVGSGPGVAGSRPKIVGAGSGSGPGVAGSGPEYVPEVELGGYGGSYCSSLYSSGSGGGTYAGLEHTGHASGATDWQMDSVIEQIEKQMAAVLEKIEGDMPSLLEQISDCQPPPKPPHTSRSTHSSPSHLQHSPTSSSSLTSTTPPPPLPTTPRPPIPTLPHLTIPPPTYPPPSPPILSPGQFTGDQEERDGHRGAGHYGQSQSPKTRRGL